MKKTWFCGLLVLLMLSLFAAGCGGGQPAAEPAGGEQPAQAEAGSEAAAPVVEAQQPSVPDNVPMLPDPIDLRVTNDSSYIAYQAQIGLQEAIQYYQDQFTELGWQTISKKETQFGDSITMLRAMPEKKQNISVTIQQVPEQEIVRVLITIIPRP